MKKILSIVLAFVLCLAFPAEVRAKSNDKISAKAVVLMDADSGEVLFKKNENKRLSPASVTKIMSLLLIMEAIDSGKISLDDKVAATKDAVSKGGSQIWLELGEEMTVDELLKAVIIASANDACTALGDFVAGSQEAFVAMMNERSRELGLKNTCFENCTGLDDTAVNHYSSAYDLAVISCELMKYSLVKKYSTVWLDSLRNGKTELNNTNKLVNTYNGITGLKTGTTSNAGFCISATATRDGLNLVAVVLGAPTSEKRFDTASSLLDYGFASYKSVKPSFSQKKITAVKVIRGDSKSVVPVLVGNTKLTVPKTGGKLKYYYNVIGSVKAPVKKGQKLGVVTVKADGKIIKTFDLVSPLGIKKANFDTIFTYVLKNI